MSTRAPATAAVLLAVALALPACGDDAPSYCADRDRLEQSLSGLADVNVVQGGVSALTDQVDEVEQDARTLAESAQGEFGEEADGLRTAVAELGDAFDSAVADPSAGTLGAVGTQISAVQAAFRQLSDAVGSSC